MSTFIIGASGLVGSHLMQAFPSSTGTYFSHAQKGLVQLDVTSYEQVEKILAELRPNCILIPAAIPGVDYCETHAAETAKTNIEGLRNVLRAAAGLKNPKIVYLSSEYVFDGKNGPYAEEDPPNPINVYGKQKLQAESLVQAQARNHIIVRTVWVYGKENARKNFLYAVLDRTRKGQMLPVPVDEISTPTSAADLGRALKTLVGRNYTGIIHIAGPERMSKFDFAEKIARAFGLSTDCLERVESDRIPRPAKRPKNAGLRIDRLRSLGIRMRALQENLAGLKQEVGALK